MRGKERENVLMASRVLLAEVPNLSDYLRGKSYVFGLARYLLLSIKKNIIFLDMQKSILAAKCKHPVPSAPPFARVWILSSGESLTRDF